MTPLAVGDLFAGRFEITEVGPACRAIDRETGAHVLLRQRASEVSWRHDVDAEACARVLAAMPVAHVRRVVFVGAGVVFEDAPGPRYEGAMPLRDAAECALQCCEVAAAIRAIGYENLSFVGSDLEAGTLDGRPSVRFTAPSLARRGATPPRQGTAPPRFQPPFLRRSEGWQEACAAASACCVLFNLSPEAYVRSGPAEAERADGPEGLRARLEQRRASRSAAVDPVIELLSRYCFSRDDWRGNVIDARLTFTVAAVAKLLADVIGTPDARARAEAVERTKPGRLTCDWDAIASDGEALLSRAEPRWKPYIALPLAEAHHQRASVQWARGDLEGALTAVNRALALDRALPYLVTRSVVLAALGRVGEARYAIDAAFEAIAALEARDQAIRERGYERYEPIPMYVPDDAERARAFAARGTIALREKRAREALSDLEEAVRLAPSSARYRWSLASCLARLERRDEAITHARRSLELDPTEARRARYERLFGTAFSG